MASQTQSGRSSTTNSFPGSAAATAVLPDPAPRTQRSPYAGFAQINGKHSFKEAVPKGFVDYEARKRPGGKVFFFNFELAREMGLIPKDHPDRLNADLCRALIDTFAIVIVNEYDLEHKTKFDKSTLKPNRYMATRYLQLQHPGRKGRTSGDGRGIWNGEFKHAGTTWDISSSGTGATCLSPAAAIEKRNFRTGDPKVCYGNGYNTVDDGLTTSLMSEIFHRNGVETERTLCIIEFPGGYSVNVRAARNLLRPSHFFHWMKQGDLEQLRGAVDFFIDRQVANGDWAKQPTLKRRYEHFGEQMALTFSKISAQFESEYIFCWLDWDGDNILTNGGIIDYGSIRQFGLFHDEYRYDDVTRFSTKLTEQKGKARYIVQTFAQIRSFLVSGRKDPIGTFAQDPLLKLFDENFETHLDALLLQKIGFDRKDREALMKSARKQVREFRKIFHLFERAQSRRGIYAVSDGVTSDAIFSMRDCLRELPGHFLREGLHMAPKEFIAMMASSYARPSDLKLTSTRVRKIRQFQTQYLNLIDQAAKLTGEGDSRRMLLKVNGRSSIINRFDRITGDAVLKVAEEFLKRRKHMPQDELLLVIEQFVQSQVLDPGYTKKGPTRPTLDAALTALDKALKKVRDHREGI